LNQAWPVRAKKHEARLTGGDPFGQTNALAMGNTESQMIELMRITVIRVNEGSAHPLSPTVRCDVVVGCCRGGNGYVIWVNNGQNHQGTPRCLIHKFPTALQRALINDNEATLKFEG